MRAPILAVTAAICLATGPAAAETTFRFAYESALGVLDQYSLNETFAMGILGNVYEGLVKRDATLSIVPGLATEWTMVDPLTWRFRLREGVRFHDGHLFTADDVVFSAERVRSENSDFRTRVPDDAVFVALDDFNLEVRLARPNPSLVAEWDTWGIMDREWAEANDAVEVSSATGSGRNYAALNANGTGPYRVVEHQSGVSTTFAVNPDWWGWQAGDRPVDRVEFTPIGSDATRVAALLTGEMDLVYPVPLQDVPRVAAQSAVEVLTGPELRTVFLGFDQVRDVLPGATVAGANPFKDVRVRRAVMLAIDEDAIAQRIMRGQARPAALLIAPELFSRASEFARPPADPAAARALLAEAGYGDGFGIVMDCPNDRYINDEQICQAVASMLARVGIRVDLRAVPKSQYFAKILASGGYDTSFFMMGWVPSGFDPWSIINNILVCRGSVEDDRHAAGAFNIGGYCNAEVDRLAAQVVVEADPVRRDDLVARIFRITTDEVAYLPLHQQTLAWGKARGVTVVPRADGILMFDLLRK